MLHMYALRPALALRSPWAFDWNEAALYSRSAHIVGQYFLWSNCERNTSLGLHRISFWVRTL